VALKTASSKYKLNSKIIQMKNIKWVHWDLNQRPFIRKADAQPTEQ
jgi:hypothetical protein